MVITWALGYKSNKFHVFTLENDISPERSWCNRTTRQRIGGEGQLTDANKCKICLRKLERMLEG